MESSPVSSPVKRTAKGRERARQVITFIENLTVPSGMGQGEAFLLELWQKQFIRDIYEPRWRNGRRAVRRAILSVARKNGKTALIATIALAHLIGPEAIINGEIYSAANDRDQAAIVFKFAKQIVELEPVIRCALRIDGASGGICLRFLRGAGGKEREVSAVCHEVIVRR